jgi:hypothetical protein
MYAPDGMQICFEVAAANVPEREAAAEMLERAGTWSPQGLRRRRVPVLMAALGAIFLRPDRKDQEPRFGGLGSVRQWVESIVDTVRGQLWLERHGVHTMPGLNTRIAHRLLAPAACLWRNWQIGHPGRNVTAYHHWIRPTESVI